MTKPVSSEMGSSTHDPQMAKMAILRFQAPDGMVYFFGGLGTISGPGIGGPVLVKWVILGSNMGFRY